MPGRFRAFTAILAVMETLPIMTEAESGHNATAPVGAVGH